MNAPLLSISENVPTIHGVIEAWLAHCAQDDHDPITELSAPFYRNMWNTWRAFLEKREGGPVAWNEAAADDVAAFLVSGPAARTTRQRVSDITRRRYWRVLDRVYAFAMASGWVTANPAAGLERAERPPFEQPRGEVMNSATWHAALQLAEEPAEDRPLAIRNRAMLLILFHLGITPQELRELTLKSVMRTLDRTTGKHGAVEGLDIEGPGPRQCRRLFAPAVVNDAIAAWLRVRSAVNKQEGNETLFCSTQNPAINPTGLFTMVQGFLKKLTIDDQVAQPLRTGPQVIRNTALVRWLESGVGVHEVAMRAGLKNARGLHHLRDHVRPEIRLQIADVRDDDPYPVSVATLHQASGEPRLGQASIPGL